jgi:ligand-binding sensor domain-containing protein
MRLTCLLLLLFGFTIARGQMPFVRELRLNEEGRPVKVNDLLQDAKGYIWLAADDGVYRYNGRTFTHLTDSSRMHATAIVYHGGKIVIGYSNGAMGIANGNTVVPMQLHGYRPFSTITSLHSVHPQMLWMTTEADGLFLVMGNTGIQITTEEGLTDNFLYGVQLQHDEVMVSTDRGINHVRWKNGKPTVEIFTTAQGLPDNIVRVLKPIPGTTQSWIGTQEGGLAIYDDNKEEIHKLQLPGGWVYGQINDILPTAKNEAWVATDDGRLVHVTLNDRGSLTVAAYEYPGKKIKKLLRDAAGNIWCATSDGLIMSTALYAQAIRIPAPYALQSVTAMACCSQSKLWYSQGSALYQMPLLAAGNAQKTASLPAAITCLHHTKNRLWIGTLGAGLFSYTTNSGLKQVGGIGSQMDGHILSITGNDEDLWISSLNGVAEMKLDEGTNLLTLARSHGKETGAGSDYVYQLYTDSRSRVWMATDGGGIRMWDGRQSHSWSAKDGLNAFVFYSVCEDREGNIWAASLGQGIYRYNGKTWSRIDEKSGLQNREVSGLLGTGAGDMVVANRDNVDQWQPGSGEFRHYNRRSGIGLDSTSAMLNCIARDNYGRVIVPYEEGFAVFAGDAHHTVHLAPRVHITSIGVFFKPVGRGKANFNHDENHLSFRYDGISYANPERLYYRYRLQGFDKEWVQTADEMVTFPQLRPGEYRFEVQASASPDFTNAATDSYTFSIAWPMWQRWWAVLLIAGLLTAAIFGYIRIRERSITRLSQLQRERMLFEYEHLKSQVNPHFLFNSLNTLASLIEEDPNSAVDYTVQLSDFYRSILAFRDKDLITLREELDIMQHYMHIQQTRFGAALQLHLSIPDVVLKNARIVPLALQLLVENAIKHNVVSLSKPLLISIGTNGGDLIISNPLQPKISQEKGSGLGLINIVNRYALLTTRKISYGPEDNNYTVTLPLL